MQHLTTKDTGDVQPPSRPAPPQDPLQALKQQLEDLAAQIEATEDHIDAANEEVKDAEKDRAQAKNRKKDLEARKAVLQRLVDGLDDGQTKIDEARQAVAQEAQEARVEHQNVTEDLAEQLSPEYRAAIQGAIQTVDGKIAELQGQQADLKGQVAQAEAQVAQANAAASEAENNLGEAQNAFRGLPGKIKAAGAQVKKTRSAMKNAFDKGQAKDAYLLATDLEDALDEVERLTSEGYEQERVQALFAAWQALKETQEAVATAIDQHRQLQDALAQVDEWLTAYTEGRRQKIEEELEKVLAALEESSEVPAEIAAY